MHLAPELDRVLSGGVSDVIEELGSRIRTLQFGPLEAADCLELSKPPILGRPPDREVTGMPVFRPYTAPGSTAWSLLRLG